MTARTVQPEDVFNPGSHSNTVPVGWLRLGKQQALDVIQVILKDTASVELMVDGAVIRVRPALDSEPRQDADTSRHVQPGIVVRADSGDVLVDGRPTPPLTNMEYRLLVHLRSRVNAIVSREELGRLLWPEEPAASVFGALEKLVSRVRLKIEPDPDKPRYLMTVRGRGYRLVSS
jgi:DNA-binding response OmpR family regulator